MLPFLQSALVFRKLLKRVEKSIDESIFVSKSESAPDHPIVRKFLILDVGERRQTERQVSFPAWNGPRFFGLRSGGKPAVSSVVADGSPGAPIGRAPGRVTKTKPQLAVAARGPDGNLSLAASGGRVAGGQHFSRGALYLTLQNRIYRGEITHQGAAYPGQHKAILDPELWQIVQDKLTANRRERSLAVGAEAPRAAPSLRSTGQRDRDRAVGPFPGCVTLLKV